MLPANQSVAAETGEADEHHKRNERRDAPRRNSLVVCGAGRPSEGYGEECEEEQEATDEAQEAQLALIMGKVMALIITAHLRPSHLHRDLVGGYDWIGNRVWIRHHLWRGDGLTFGEPRRLPPI